MYYKLPVLKDLFLAYGGAWAGMHFTGEEIKSLALAVAAVLLKEGVKYVIERIKDARTKANHPNNKA
jgi:hypothetical protein